MLEKQIESAVCDYANSKGFLAYKFASPNRAAVPDRMMVLPSGHIFFVEFKAEGKKPYFPAAMFYFENNVDLKQALAWMNAGLAEQPEAFWMIYRKGLLLAKMGDKAGAKPMPRCASSACR